MHKLFCIVILPLFLSCSSEKTAELGGKKPPVAGSSSALESFQTDGSVSSRPYSLEITPAKASRSSALKLVARGFNLSDVKVEWLLNDKPIEKTGFAQFSADRTRKGDKVQARAIVQGREILSNSINIKNAPPEIIKYRMLPEVFKPGDTLYVEAVGSDIDGDSVTILYEWTKNREPAGNTQRIETPLKRGDWITIKMTPFDGETYGQSVIRKREIRNMPPMIIDEDKKFAFDGKVYTYQVRAVDPDGDTLTYSLKSAKEEIKIDSVTGLITWNVSDDFLGDVPITVSVTDGHEGESTQGLTLSIREEK